MKNVLLYSLALVLCANIAQAQSDTLFWSENLALGITNKTNANPCNNFAVSYMKLSSPADSTVYYRAIISQEQSWLCSGIDDEAENDLAFYLLSMTELWTRQLCIYRKNNSELPPDYLQAYLEDGWEQHQKHLIAEQTRYAHGDDTAGLSQAISETLKQLRQTPSPVVDSRPTDYGYGMDFFGSAAHTASSMLHNPYGMGISLQFFVKKTGIKLQGNLMYGTAGSAPAGSKLLSEGQNLQHGEFSLQIEQRILDNYRISVAPFAGYGYSEIQVADSLASNDQIGRRTPRITNFAPTVGVNVDFKLRGQLLDTEDRFGADSYWLVRAGLFYTPMLYAEGEKYSLVGLKVGLGGFSKFWH